MSRLGFYDSMRHHDSQSLGHCYHSIQCSWLDAILQKFFNLAFIVTINPKNIRGLFEIKATFIQGNDQSRMVSNRNATFNTIFF